MHRGSEGGPAEAGTAGQYPSNPTDPAAKLGRFEPCLIGSTTHAAGAPSRLNRQLALVEDNETILANYADFLDDIDGRRAHWSSRKLAAEPGDVLAAFEDPVRPPGRKRAPGLTTQLVWPQALRSARAFFEE